MPPRIPPRFADLRSYLAGTPASPPRIKLSANENPLGPSPRVLEAMRRAVESANVYPDGAARAFKAKVADVHGVDPSWIAVGAGSDEIVRLLGSIFLDSHDSEVLTAEPSFSTYSEIAAFAGAKAVKVLVDERRTPDLEAMAYAITPNTRLVFLANPNNPTGAVVREQPLSRFLDQVPDTALLVLDEAYFEYARSEPDYPDGIQLLKSGRTICVLRTFSKVHGLAALRMGYAVADPTIVDVLERARPPFNANAVAQAAAIAALEDSDHVEQSLVANAIALQRLRGILESLGATVFPSYANFVYAELPGDAEPLARALMERGIAIRAGAQVWRPESIRISAGTPDQLDELEAALSTIQAESAPA